MLDTFQRYLQIYDLVRQISRESGASDIQLLDVGSNGPGFARYNHFKNVRQTNIDITETTPDVMKEFPRVNFLCYKGKQLPFEENHFDIVICVDVLEHISPENRKDFVLEVLRVSKKKVVFAFPVSSSEKWEIFLSKVTFHKIKFLQEHLDFGLPKEKYFTNMVLKSKKAKVLREYDNINIWLWIPVKLLSSLLYRVLKNRNKLAYITFLVYKYTFSKILNWGQCYAKVYILEKY